MTRIEKDTQAEFAYNSEFVVNYGISKMQIWLSLITVSAKCSLAVRSLVALIWLLSKGES